MALSYVKKAKSKTAHEQDRIIIRLPDGLHAKLQAVASETRQTMTQVAVALMEQGLARYETNTDKASLLDRNAANTLSSLAKIIDEAQEARSAFQALLLAEKKDR